ncbi:MAG: hypothetical protein J7J54_07195 [Candidatus Omnitrophica bacterium]|nr:hypothetical protein [Candidatus Omnitrophota bacterium]
MRKIISLILIIKVFFSLPSFCEVDKSDKVLLSHFLKLLKSTSFYLKDNSEVLDIALPDASSQESLNTFIKRIREKGYPVGIWSVPKEEIDKVSFPFLTCLKDEGWVIVKAREGRKWFVEDEKEEKTISQETFVEKWPGFLISLYMCGVWLETLGKDEEEADFYIICSYHDEHFSLIRKYLEEILSFADKNQKLLYVDELGLIPLDTVNNYMKIYQLSEKDAFRKIKEQLAKEVKNLGKGIPIYDPLDTYNRIYQFLADKRIDSTMEDLDYMNWRKIVILDHIGLLKNAFLAFCCGDLDLYLNFLTEYNNKYWKYNMNERDNNFVEQLIKIKKVNPNRLIFTIRGLSHLGLEEKLFQKGYNVKFVIVGKGFVLNNIAYRHFVFINYNTNTVIDERKPYTFAFVQETIRDFLVGRDKLSLREATIKASELVKNLNISDIEAISKELSKKNFKSEQQKVSDFIYRWIKGKMRK